MHSFLVTARKIGRIFCDSPGLSVLRLAQECLELAEELFDRVEVRRICRQINCHRTGLRAYTTSSDVRSGSHLDQRQQKVGMLLQRRSAPNTAWRHNGRSHESTARPTSSSTASGSVLLGCEPRLRCVAWTEWCSAPISVQYPTGSKIMCRSRTCFPARLTATSCSGRQATEYSGWA
jgi:hypothetical protein